MSGSACLCHIFKVLTCPNDTGAGANAQNLAVLALRFKSFEAHIVGFKILEVFAVKFKSFEVLVVRFKSFESALCFIFLSLSA